MDNAGGAAPEDLPASVTAVFLQYGLLGACLLVLGWFVYRLIIREQKRADAADAALADQNLYNRDHVIPALVESNRVLSEVARALTEATRVMTETTTMLRDRERR